MPVIFKVCVIFLTVSLLRCPAVAQQLSTRLASLSLNCTQENRLLKQTSKQRILTERDARYLAAGVEYHRTTTIADARVGTIERQARLGVPVILGYRSGKVSFEAGGFFGVNMTRPQRGFWFADPDVAGAVINRHMTPAAALLISIGVATGTNGSFRFTFTNFNDLPDENVLGNLQLGWRYTW